MLAGRLSLGATLGMLLETSACAHGLDVAGVVRIPAGPFERGSDLDARARALDTAYATGGRPSPARVGAIKHERPATSQVLPEYWMMVTPVTQAQYHAYVVTTGSREPWLATIEHPLWRRGRPTDRAARHPVVLVSHDDALAYCTWWGLSRGGVGQLPDDAQWEKAARGIDGRPYPWGQRFDPNVVNTEASGPSTTSAVNAHPTAQSPYGLDEMAGNVFEWTRTPADPGTFIVKGGSWRSDAAAARAAAHDIRPAGVRDVDLGFRCTLQRS